MRTWVALAITVLACSVAVAEKEDVDGVSSEKLQVKKDGRKSYFLIHKDGEKAPAEGYRLLVVLPGGDGSEAFHPFVKRIHKNALPPGYLTAQLIAFKWTPDQQIVWPHQNNKVPNTTTLQKV